MILLELLFAWQWYARPAKLPEITPPPTTKIVEEVSVLGAGFRQTFYSVLDDNETNIGFANLSFDDMQIFDNVIHFDDSEYGWLPVVAVDIDAVVATGLNEYGTYNAYGSVLNIQYEDGTNNNAIVLDACGACAELDRIDLWVYRDDYIHDKPIEAIEIMRRGFEEAEDDRQ